MLISGHSVGRTSIDKARRLTGTLCIAVCVTALLNVFFGFDTTSFAGVQNIPSFQRKFGTPTGEDGKYRLSAARASFMSSIAFAGKITGTLLAPGFIERFGHRKTIWMLCTISVLGVAIETASSTIAGFVTGRIVVYISVGLAENTSTTYQSETVPASMRGAVVGSCHLMIQFGQILAASINEHYSRSQENSGWRAAVGVQAVVPFCVFLGTFFIPSAPRWLISKHRPDEAIASLAKLRPGGFPGAVAEAEAIQTALDTSNVDKGPWRELFYGVNRRRTRIAIMVFLFQQLTGTAFVSQYQPRFYTSVGLEDHAFEYTLINTFVGLAGVVLGMLLVDTLGRRVLLISGGVLQAIPLFMLAGVGGGSAAQTGDYTKAQTNTMVASVMLFNFFFAGTYAPIAYVIAAEIGTAALREKTMSLSSSLNVVAAWLVAFSVPYLLDSIGVNIGWIFGSMATLATVYAYFEVPEIMHRSLEELDELFERGTPANKFQEAKTHGAAARIAELERSGVAEREERRELLMDEEDEQTTPGNSHADEDDNEDDNSRPP